MKLYPTPTTRFVVVDIETAALNPEEAKGALSALTGRIVCIGMLIDDGQQITELTLADENETVLLQRFWQEVRPLDVFIGHNILSFDLPFIRQRSWINGVRPSRRIDLRKYYTQDVQDTMQIFSVWGATSIPKLDALAVAFDLPRKTASGADVAEWWAKRDLGAIADYCREDVRLTYKVFLRLMFQPLPARILRLVCAPQDNASSATALTACPLPNAGPAPR